MGAIRAWAGGGVTTGMLLVAALLPGCAWAPDYEGPPYRVGLEQYAGSVLSGPLATQVDGNTSPWVLELRLVRVDDFRPPEGEEGEALAARVQYVFAQPSAEPLKPRSELATGVLVYPGDTPLGRVSWEEVYLEALWPGSAVHFEAVPVHEAAHSENVPWNAFGWRVSRPLEQPQGLEVALTFDGWVTAPQSEQEISLDENAEPEKVMQRELLVFDGQRLLAGDRVRMVLTAPRPGLPRAAEVLEARLVQTLDRSDPRVASALQRGRGRLALAQRRARERSSGPPPQTGWEGGRNRAMEKLAVDPLDRGAMLYLAEAGQSTLAVDLVLVAPDELLLDYTAFAAAAYEQSDPDLVRAQDDFGWFLERNTYLWLAAVAVDPARGLPEELQALMLRHCGELGRYPDLIVETVRAGGGRDAVHARIVHENRIFLADAHPAARVRAYDWLRQRGMAPEGYDPLAPREQRRAALEAMETLIGGQGG